MNTNENKEFISSMPQRGSSLEFDIGFIGAPRRPAETAAPTSDECGVMQMPALLSEIYEVQNALRKATDPTQQRADLKQRINLAVGNPAAHDWWVSGCAADLVVNRGVDVRHLIDLLTTVSRRRKLPTNDPYHINSPQAWLQRAIAKLANQRGIPFGKRAAESADT